MNISSVKFSRLQCHSFLNYCPWNTKTFYFPYQVAYIWKNGFHKVKNYFSESKRSWLSLFCLENMLAKYYLLCKHIKQQSKIYWNTPIHKTQGGIQWKPKRLRSPNKKSISHGPFHLNSHFKKSIYLIWLFLLSNFFYWLLCSQILSGSFFERGYIPVKFEKIFNGYFELSLAHRQIDTQKIKKKFGQHSEICFFL